MPNRDSVNPLRVMMLSQRIPPANCTGAPLQAWHLSKALVSSGLAVEITTTHRIGIRPRPESLDGLPVRAQSYLGGPGLAEFSRFVRAACTSFPARAWDVVHGHALSPMVLGAALGKTAHSAPLLVKPSIGGEHAEGEIKRIRASAAYPLFLKALRKIDMFAVLDDLIEADLELVGIPPERRRRVDNGIDLQAYRPADISRKAVLRREFGLSRSRVVLFCGQLSERKGIGQLLSAWPAELARKHDAALVLCGDGPLRQQVQKAVASGEGGVEYLGPVTDTTRIIQMADVLVLPSRCESFGNVIMEALASAVPVAATPCGIAPRVLEDGRSGWLIAAADNASIATSLQRVFADIDCWEEKGAVGRLVAEQFSMDRVANDYIALYCELASTHDS